MVQVTSESGLKSEISVVGTHLNEPATHLGKRRIVCEVSEEVASMWDEIVAHDRSTHTTGKRFYPAHSL
jgi:hypothetical protein